MKCFILLIVLVFFGIGTMLHAQMMPPMGIDTALGNTETAAKAASWLQRLSLPTGAGSIAALSGFSAQALISDSSKRFADANGMTAYYASALYQTDLRNIRSILLQRALFMRKAGVLVGRDPATFSWGVLEPVKGTYNFSLLDSLIAVMGDYSIPFMGTIIPFSDWASSCNASQANNMACTNLFSSAPGADYFFINQAKIGPVCDTAALYSFVQRVVERYDGDGIDDLPTLKKPIRYWEFGNEPDAGCGGYNEGRMPSGTSRFGSAFARDQSIAYRAMKAACPSCQMMNGGAVESFDVAFWNTVLDTLLPNKRYTDITNIHVNVGKQASPATWDWGTNFYRYFSIFQNSIAKNRVNVPIWITEWGFYTGAPTTTVAGSTTPITLPNRTEEEQASIYAKFYAWGKANNLPVIVYDFQGGSDALTSSALLQTGGTGGIKARLCYHTLRMLEYKYRDLDSARQITFSTAGNLTLPQGHIRMFKRGAASDVLWGLTALPAGITGRKVRTDMYGNTDTLDAAQIRFPLGSTPIVLENAPTLSSVFSAPVLENMRISPNPASTLVRVEGYAKEPSLLTLSLVNALGQELVRLPAEWTAGEFSHTINLEQFPQGSYFLRLQTPTAFHIKPVQVLR